MRKSLSHRPPGRVQNGMILHVTPCTDAGDGELESCFSDLDQPQHHGCVQSGTSVFIPNGLKKPLAGAPVRFLRAPVAHGPCHLKNSIRGLVSELRTGGAWLSIELKCRAHRSP
jgi:hypothetical protein